MKKILIVFLTTLLALSLCACGNTLTVDYVSADYKIVSEYYNNTVKLDIDDDLFKDCTLEEEPFIAYDDMYKKLVVNKDGADMVYAVKGGMLLKVKDQNGNVHNVKIDEGSTFKTVGSGDDMQLILPSQE